MNNKHQKYLFRPPGVVVSSAAFLARVRGSVPGLGGLKETKMFLSHPRVKLSIEGSLCDREVACSASDHQGLNFEFCVWRTVSSHSSHHPQEVPLAQFSLYVHKGGLKADSFHFFCFGPQVTQNQLIEQFRATKKKKFNLHFDSHFVSCLYEGKFRDHFGFFLSKFTRQ